MTTCPNRPNGTHSFTFSVGAGQKVEFVPVEFGQSAADTLYRAVSYSYLACSCGTVKKSQVIMEDA